MPTALARGRTWAHILAVARREPRQLTSSQSVFRKIVDPAHAVPNISTPELRYGGEFENRETVSEGTRLKGSIDFISDAPYDGVNYNSYLLAGETVVISKPCPTERLQIYAKNTSGLTVNYGCIDPLLAAPNTPADAAPLLAGDGGFIHWGYEAPVGQNNWKAHGVARFAGASRNGVRWLRLDGVQNPVPKAGSNGSWTQVNIVINWTKANVALGVAPGGLLTNQILPVGPDGIGSGGPVGNGQAQTGGTFGGNAPLPPVPIYNDTTQPQAPALNTFAIQVWRRNKGRPVLVGTFPVSFAGWGVNGSLNYNPILYLGWNPNCPPYQAGLPSASNPSGTTSSVLPPPFEVTPAGNAAVTVTPAQNVVMQNIFNQPDHYAFSVVCEQADIDVSQYLYNIQFAQSCGTMQCFSEPELLNTFAKGGMFKTLAASFCMLDTAEAQYKGGQLAAAEMQQVDDEWDILWNARLGQGGAFQQTLAYQDSYGPAPLVDGIHCYHQPHARSDYEKWRLHAISDWLYNQVLDCANNLDDDRPSIVIVPKVQSVVGNASGNTTSGLTGQGADLAYEAATLDERLSASQRDARGLSPDSNAAWTDAINNLKLTPIFWSYKEHREMMLLDTKTGKRVRDE